MRHEMGIRVPVGKLLKKVGDLENSVNGFMHSMGFKETMQITSVVTSTIETSRELTKAEIDQITDIAIETYKENLGYASLEYFKPALF